MQPLNRVMHSPASIGTLIAGRPLRGIETPFDPRHMNTYAHAPTHGPDQPALAETPAKVRPAGNGRLIAWLVLVAVLAALSFAGNAAVSNEASQPSSPVYYSSETPDGGTLDGYGQRPEPHDDSAYRWATGIGGL